MRELIVSLLDGSNIKFLERNHEVEFQGSTLLVYEYSKHGNPEGLCRRIKRAFAPGQWISFEEREGVSS